jgi:crotonobetainyl-CoA:carnitine CoA-transferase CaiB-like acyl-CoA transferase
MHAAIATILALLEHHTTGGGALVESVMVEAALNAAAEQVVEFSTTGTRLCRQGNRGPDAAPQGVYPCAGTDAWVAIAVRTDDQWRRLAAALNGPAWAADTELDTAAGRRATHDDIDKHLTEWTSGRDAADVAELLSAAGVPAEVVISARDILDNPQVRHRRLFEIEHHPVTGDHELPALPLRFSRVPSWLSRPSPTVGQHNSEILAELGLTPDEIDALAAAGIIGQRPTGV